jgi:hypothetical protein
MSSTADAPRLRVREIRLYRRPVRLRMPFRFGVVTLHDALQAFARVRVEVGDGEAWGMAAEMLAPKWFDKDLALTNDDNVEQLRVSLRVACAIYLAAPPRTAFDLFAGSYRPQIEECRARKLNPLVAGYGPALLDRAILDAVCRKLGLSFYDAVRANVPAIHGGDLTPDLRGFDVPRFVAGLAPAAALDARHTVGLVDPITREDLTAPGPKDGLPETLEEVVRAYGHAYYKLKVGGDVAQDVARLGAIARVLDTLPAPYHVTLDGNEQYADVERALELVRAIAQTAALRRLADSILFIEQPITRARALDADVTPLAAHRPVIVDESDAELDSFPRARALGYAGVSSKTCKGLYKSILNQARCELWNRAGGGRRYFMSAEDLTTQAGVSVQQDLALVSLLGLGHVEKNGHHYVNGMAAAPAAEQRAFLAAHPDLYHEADGVVRVRITAGRMSIGSLGCAGFASAAEPDWRTLAPLD